MLPIMYSRGMCAIVLASILSCTMALPGNHQWYNQTSATPFNESSIINTSSRAPSGKFLDSIPELFNTTMPEDQTLFTPVPTQNRITNTENSQSGGLPYQPKGVFAHFMVSNVHSWTQANWESEIEIAQHAHIDAFALNIAYDQHDEPQIEHAFAAATARNFRLFFSFDYVGNGPWDPKAVTHFVRKWGSQSAYYRYRNQPFVSTFEGPGSSADWYMIKKDTGCFLIPDWSSDGAKAALQRSNGVADGLFSWAAWPWGNQDSTTYVDASYKFYLDKKPYMMPVSPWFYTNMPGFDKNWVWRGDDLWRDRWEQVMVVKPEFVQIISWNDYGESHYIGPIHKEAMEAFTRGKVKNNYAIDLPHDGWRALLPFYVDRFKGGKPKVEEQRLVMWYRPLATDACKTVTTSGNTASQLQLEFHAHQIMQDEIFFSALLISDAKVSITIGGVPLVAKFDHKPEGSVGVYHGSAKINGHKGPVQITVQSSEGTLSLSGRAITGKCEGEQNWNAWVGSQTGPKLRNSKSPLVSGADLACIEGTASGEFKELCEATCKRGYCPISACLCTKLGAQPRLPPAKKGKWYPAEGKSSNFDGLCNYACSYGVCPKNVCSNSPKKRVEPTVSPFTPIACTAGRGDGQLAELCKFSCKYGFCPINSCTCTTRGTLQLFSGSVKSDIVGALTSGAADDGLCTFACARGTCPYVCSRGTRNNGKITWDSDRSSNRDCNIDTAALDVLFLDLSKLRSQSQTCQLQQLLTTYYNMIEEALLHYYSATRLTGAGYFKGALKHYIDAKRIQIQNTMQNSWFKSGGLSRYFVCTLATDYGYYGKKGDPVSCPSNNTESDPPNVHVVLKKEKEQAFWDEMYNDYGMDKSMILSGGSDFKYAQHDSLSGDIGERLPKDRQNHDRVITNFPKSNEEWSIDISTAWFGGHFSEDVRRLKNQLQALNSTLQHNSSTESKEIAINAILASETTIIYALDLTKQLVVIKNIGLQHYKSVEVAEIINGVTIGVDIVAGVLSLGGASVFAEIGAALLAIPVAIGGSWVVASHASQESLEYLGQAAAGVIGGLVGLEITTGTIRGARAGLSSAGAKTLEDMATRFHNVPVSQLARTGRDNSKRFGITDLVTRTCRRT